MKKSGIGLIGALRWIINAFTITCFISMFCIVLSLVFYRFVLHKPHFWGEEMARYLMVVSLFLALGIGVKNKVHLNVTFFVNMLPAKASRVVLIVAGVATTVCYVGLTAMAVSFFIAVRTMRQTSAALKIPTWILYCFIAIGFALCALESVLALYNDFFKGRPVQAGEKAGKEGEIE